MGKPRGGSSQRRVAAANAHAAQLMLDTKVRRSLGRDQLIVGTRRFGEDAAHTHDISVRKAHAWIHARHTVRCGESTPKYFANFHSAGIGNDVNQAVRSLAIALCWKPLNISPLNNFKYSALGSLPPFSAPGRVNWANCEAPVFCCAIVYG